MAMARIEHHTGGAADAGIGRERRRTKSRRGPPPSPGITRGVAKGGGGKDDGEVRKERQGQGL